MDVNIIDDRWNMVGSVIERHGSKNESIAWSLCRGDAAEWRLAALQNKELATSHNTAMRKLLLDLQGYFNAKRGADRYYRDYDLKERINAVVAQLPQ